LRTITVHLAGRAYEVAEQPSRRNAAWRAQLREPFGALVARLEQAGETDITSLEQVATLVRETVGTLLAAPDTLAELLFAYSPALAADREQILEEAYDSELMAAFTAVLGLAYPFGAVLQKVKGLADLGQSGPTTGPS